MVTKDKIKATLEQLRVNEKSLSHKESENKKLQFCISILEEFYNDYDNWSAYCSYSNKTVSSSISPNYIDINGISDRLYIACAKFLREYILYLERKGEQVFIENEWYSFKHEAKNIILPDYMPILMYTTNGEFDISVINHFLGGKSYRAFVNYESNVKEAERKVDEINTKISQATKKLEELLAAKEYRVNQLAGILDEQKIAFNFVGLSQGFSSLLNKKRNSKNIVLSLLFFIGVFLFIPLFTYIEIQQFRNDSKQDLFEWIKFIPFIGVELIILYLFRVVLSHYNSIKAEIIQLELRQTLCQFIQSYAEYAKEIKEKDSSSLEKFENLIFSSILSSSDKIPSTFDGLEQIINIIKEIKKPAGSA